MKKYITLSNIIFVLAIALLLYKPSKVWLIRQVAFSPSIEKVEKSARVFNYNWQLKGLNTNDINFTEFKGKVVFLNFWATWCPPCIAELPSVQKFYNDYQDKVAFIFITSEDSEAIIKFFKENEYEFPVYQSNSILNELPPVNSIPRTFVLDKEGNIRIDKSGAANWRSKSFLDFIDEVLVD
ncbi:TlpA family protein disulfide reductase [Tenacibaculum sp. SZ-18]|uniref:TlpA family protein disulfide reductase n=1 Tax=Tenacibaculum sp. SZ-18 TaxID=754423 RepID=UPI0012FDD471|nr:TlpA disulfide reductase family protein [Tenacibaculum sp. SZ-18]